MTASHVIRKFNPGTLQSDKEVIEQFVVRQKEFEEIRNILLANATSETCTHVLVTGSRGQGKTMLLARIAAELRKKDEACSELFLPIRFAEENHEVSDMTDFWLETLFHLSRDEALDVEYGEELREGLKSRHDDLARHWNERTTVSQASDAVLDVLKRQNKKKQKKQKKLVLMIENVQDLFRNVDDDFTANLCRMLRSEPRITIIATATSQPEAQADPEEAFFDLFHKVDLKPLNKDGCRELWEMLSGDRNSARNARPLQILTGGNPRLIVILSSVSAVDSLRGLIDALISMVDEHTEYFRGRLDALGRTERRVYIAVLALGKPSTVTEIWERSRLDLRNVSVMLGRLAKRGMVKAQGAGKKFRYSAAERLDSVYYKLRHDRDEGQIIRGLLRFMTVFYDASQLRQLLAPIGTEDPDNWRFKRFKQVKQVKQKVIELKLERIREAYKTNDFASVVRLTTDVSRSLATGTYELPELVSALIYFVRAFALDELRKDDRSTLEAYEEAIQKFAASSVSEVQAWSAAALVNKGSVHKRLGELQQAIECYESTLQSFGRIKTAAVKPAVARAMVNKGNALRASGDHKEAVALFKDTIERFSSEKIPELQVAVGKAWLNMGSALAEKREFEAANDACDEMVERFGANNAPELRTAIGEALLNKGLVQEKLGNLAEAIRLCEEVDKRFGSSDMLEHRVQIARALADKGMRLNKIGMPEKALETCEKLEAQLDALTGYDYACLEWHAINIRTAAYLLLKRRNLAIDVLRSAYSSCDCDNNVAYRGLIQLVFNSVVAGAPEKDLVEILRRDRAKSVSLEPVVVALRQRNGETVHASDEVLEVAEDVLERIGADIAEKDRKALLS